MSLSLVIVLCSVLWACTDKEEQPPVVPDKNDDTYLPSKVRPVLDEVQRTTFKYFYNGADPVTGMAYEGNERGAVVTTGGTGFGLMSLIVGAERNWITREQAADRTLRIVNFLNSCERFHGVWSHWYHTDGTAYPFGDQIKTGDVVETGLLTGGLIAALEYYTGNTSTENQIRSVIHELWSSIDWNFYTNGKNVLHWLWYSEKDQFSLEIKGWHEAWNAYIFALAAPAPHNISTAVYKQGWQSNGNFSYSNRSFYGYPLPLGEAYGGPLFFAHYSMLGLDPGKLEDEYVNYWQQTTSHTMINRHYCLYQAPENYKYDESNWGLTACYGTGSMPDYKARSPRNDDGVIAPTAALGSYPYTPFYSTQVLLQLHSLSYLIGEYGLGDSYRPMEKTAEKRHLAIDQGPIVVMIENYRSGLIWDLVMKNEYVKKGLELAGIKSSPDHKEGFHLAVINTRTGVYEMMIHPDREKYELDFFAGSAGTAGFVITHTTGEKVLEKNVSATKGENVFSFFDEEILRGQEYKITMTVGETSCSLDVILR